MGEGEVREALRAAYADDAEPVMGLSAEGVLRAGRRSRRNRRRAGFAGAGLAAVLAGAGVVVATGAGSGGAEFAAAEPCLVPPGERPSGVIAAGRTLPPDVVEWAATSLTCALGDEVPRLLPDARYARVPGAPAEPLTGFSLGGDRVDALALIRDAEGTGDLTVNVAVVAESAAAQAEDQCRKETASKCTVRSGPGGETVLLGTEADGLPAAEPRNFVVRVYRGHSEIYVQVSNTDRRAAGGGAPVATRPEPVLTADQAVRLALSDKLFLFP
ncbi:hypothetical protein ACQPZJ_23160 [Actinoplanes sp. CA-054009]